jgi:hypothetical protein
LNPICDEQLSNVAFKFNLRRYSLGAEAGRITLFNRRGVGALPVERRLPTMRSEVMPRRSDSGSVQSLYV